MMSVIIEIHINEAVSDMHNRIEKAMEIIGGMVESFAKNLCPVKTNVLRNSITHTIEDEGRTTVIGSNVEYAPYVELGTGQYAEGGNGRKTPWVYKDEKGVWHRTTGRKPKPYLRPAVEDHIKEYEEVLKNELSS
jgi:predicted DNA-binding protein